MIYTSVVQTQAVPYTDENGIHAHFRRIGNRIYLISGQYPLEPLPPKNILIKPGTKRIVGCGVTSYEVEGWEPLTVNVSQN